jgi:hypothetical protein
VLADEFGVSGERVRQIEMLAFEKVQKAVQHWVVAIERPKRRITDQQFHMGLRAPREQTQGMERE